MKKIYLIAVILALVTGIAAYSYFRSREAALQPEEIPMTTVVVSTAEIGEGVFITNDMVQLKPIPTEFVAAGALTTIGDAVGKVNKYRCMAGQQIVFDQLGSTQDADITAGGRLSYMLSPGMRAMTVYVTEITGVAGYINPGDRVDILCTYSFSVPDEDEAGGEDEDEEIQVQSSMVLLENISVLEAGIITQKLTEAAGAEKAVYSSLTLELSPEDAVKLQYAVTYGQISLLLRAVDDEKIVEPPMYTNTHICRTILTELEVE